MQLSLALPNLLVGLREGLEAGLVVTILLGAVRKLAPGRSLAPVWLGVAAATALSASFGAVLTFSRAALSPVAQEVFGGVTSLVAVALVTTMVFWMRSAARGLSGEIRGKVGDALAAGGSALVVTAFVSVAREGLEAALFVWTNAQAAGSTTAPLLGALVGLLVAGGLCTGLYRKVLTINLGRFFTVTGAVLVVIVAGVLAYGLGDLQDAGVLGGGNRTAFDVSATVPTGSWWTEIIKGITNLDNRMSVLQVAAYLGYLVVVMALFLRRPTRSSRPATTPAPVPVAAAPATTPAAVPARTPAPRGRRRLLTGAAVVLVPALAATGWVVLAPSATATTDTAVSVAESGCATGWSAPAAGATTYSVTNAGTHAVDVEVVDAASQGVLAEIEVLGPGTTRGLPVTLADGSYRWKCVFAGAATLTSAAGTVSGTSTDTATTALAATTDADLAPVLAAYATFVDGQLGTLDTQVAALTAAARTGDRAATEAAWVPAHLTYHRIGAAYDAFGDAGDAVDGLSSGLPWGTSDPGFTGFHRVEHDLWSGSAMSTVATEAAALQTAVRALRTQEASFTYDANDVTTRAHEILEDTLRFTLTGQDDDGSHTGLATEGADLDGDRVLVGLLTPLLDARSPHLVATATAGMDALAAALTAAAHSTTQHAGTATTPQVNAATSSLLETLAPIPDLLEVHQS